MDFKSRLPNLLRQSIGGFTRLMHSWRSLALLASWRFSFL
ncbi:hypothetical protein K2D_07490 [Planctomycetes bacterium K2D]|uniref:Uncharacterized protein n=1 Tax=Botrimarina mediterranea TaxID=2528022 RepID=A0A518K469_9BACT|nr:hypothetical protein Spa11_07680 [Botrimarina mediterranea]QDV77161.1 hypothetical protein K2D_07490 [Planctomycetes bacterium K2D]